MQANYLHGSTFVDLVIRFDMNLPTNLKNSIHHYQYFKSHDLNMTYICPIKIIIQLTDCYSKFQWSISLFLKLQPTRMQWQEMYSFLNFHLVLRFCCMLDYCCCFICSNQILFGFIVIFIVRFVISFGLMRRKISCNFIIIVRLVENFIKSSFLFKNNNKYCLINIYMK